MPNAWDAVILMLVDQWLGCVQVHFCSGTETTSHPVWLFLHVTFNFIYRLLQTEESSFKKKKKHILKEKMGKVLKKKNSFTEEQITKKHHPSRREQQISSFLHQHFHKRHSESTRPSLSLPQLSVGRPVHVHATVDGWTCGIGTDRGETSSHRPHLPSRPPTKSNKGPGAVNALGNYSNTRFGVRFGEQMCAGRKVLRLKAF